MLTMVIRKSVFKELNISFNKQYQIIGDFDFSITVAQRKKIGVVQEPVAYYRKHNESLSAQELNKPIDELQNWIKSQNLREYELKYINYNLYRRIFIRNINKKSLLLSSIDILNYPISYILKLRCFIAGIKYLIQTKILCN